MSINGRIFLASFKYDPTAVQLVLELQTTDCKSLTKSPGPVPVAASGGNGAVVPAGNVMTSPDTTAAFDPLLELYVPTATHVPTAGHETLANPVSG
jgi:hypothetical protein